MAFEAHQHAIRAFVAVALVGVMIMNLHTGDDLGKIIDDANATAARTSAGPAFQKKESMALPRLLAEFTSIRMNLFNAATQSNNIVVDLGNYSVLTMRVVINAREALIQLLAISF